MRFNPTVSVYWLWLIVIGCILAVVPSVPYSGGNGVTGSFYVMFLYGAALYDLSDPYSTVDNKWIMLHAAVSVVSAIIATMVHDACTKPCQAEYKQDSKTFTWGGLLLAITALACVFGFLAFLGVSFVVYLVVLTVVAGRIATLLFAVIGL
jgi:hypothetical protein